MDIENRVIEIVQTNIENQRVIDAEAQFSELPINSIEFIKIVIELETEFDFEFEDNKLLFSEFQTVQSMIDYVLKRTEGSR